jgi:adenosine deaminase
MHDAGLMITLATDDPALFETDIGEAYRRVCLGTRLGVTEVRALALNAVQAAWLEEPSRTQLRREFEAEIEALTRAFTVS